MDGTSLEELLGGGEGGDGFVGCCSFGGGGDALGFEGGEGDPEGGSCGDGGGLVEGGEGDKPPGGVEDGGGGG